MSFGVAEILDWVGGEVANAKVLGEKLKKIRVDRPSSLSKAVATDIAYFFNKSYAHELAGAQPGILITGDPFAKELEKARLPLWETSAVVVCPDPYWAMALLSEKFEAPQALKECSIHPTAVVDSGMRLPARIRIGPYCVLEKNVRLGEDTVLYAHCYLGQGVTLGHNCVLFPNVVLYPNTQIGNRVRIHAGAVLGSDGFGYAPKIENGKVISHQKIYHLGRVVVGDDVEIGANACVDRGTIEDTIIEDLVKIDNDVHIGHNCKLEKGAVICGATALAGNVSVGEFAYIGGLTGIANNVHVGARAKVGGMSLLSKDVPEGGAAVGNPQRDYKNHFKVHAYLNRQVKDMANRQVKKHE